MFMKKTLERVKKRHTRLNTVVDLTSVKDLYGKQNLAATTLFRGGYINFGYWNGLQIDRPISHKTRICSSKKLYEKVFDFLKVNRSDAVLEIGCGLGNGCLTLHKEYKPKFVLGMDSSPEQIHRATKRHKNYLKAHKDSVRFFVANAESIQSHPESVSKVFSVEALQHFESYDKFVSSTFRVLKQGGKLVVTTFFFCTTPSNKLLSLFPNFSLGVDKVIKLQDFLKSLKRHGFTNIKAKSIGMHVWPGFDKWISQTEYKDTWDKNWIIGYRSGVIDYYIITAEKPFSSK